MRILVIGGGGFLGSELITQLAKDKAIEVAILDNFIHGFPAKTPSKRNIIPPIVGNIRNFSTVANVLEKTRPDVVVHLAAFITRPENIGDFRKCAEINYVGTANLIDACVQVNKPSRRIVKKIVFASCESARDPQSNFGISKLASEKLLASICPVVGIDLAILRFAEIFGYSKSQTSTSIINFLVDNMVVGNGIGLFGVKSLKDYVHISDAVRAIELAIRDEITSLCNVDIGTGVGESIQTTVDRIKKIIGFDSPLQYLEDPAVRVVDSISDPKPARDLWNFVCNSGDFEEQITALIKKRRKDLK